MPLFAVLCRVSSTCGLTEFFTTPAAERRWLASEGVINVTSDALLFSASSVPAIRQKV